MVCLCVCIYLGKCKDHILGKCKNQLLSFLLIFFDDSIFFDDVFFETGKCKDQLLSPLRFFYDLNQRDPEMGGCQLISEAAAQQGTAKAQILKSALLLTFYIKILKSTL
jgi:hypothetical protein